ncbi:MAG: TetR/AcrR family transcriptional regulator [Rubrobacter sp.]|jgi:AcrR family transcriptional regulator|nr:TetR/AcrR family transcriptional regulator [Rubrobacter sp.]
MEDKAVLETEDLRPKTEAAARILAVASELFYRDGIRAVGVDAIAAESGVTKMTLYKHFGAKDRLVAAYLHVRDEKWRDWVLKSVGARAGGPTERILAVFDALGAWLESQDGMRGCAFVNASVEVANPDHPAQTVIEDQKRWMRGYLKQLAEEADVEEPDKLADQLLVLVEGATITAVMRTAKESVERAKEAAEVLIEAG